jgi:hypothetical protein
MRAPQIILLICLFCCHSPAAVAQVPDVSSCRVAEIISTQKTDSFTCRIANFPGIGPVRLRVTIRNLSPLPPDTVAAKKGAEFTAEKLNSAKSVILRNIKMGSYFRVTADVKVNSRDLAHALITAGLANPIQKPPQTKSRPFAWDTFQEPPPQSRTIAPTPCTSPAIHKKYISSLSRDAQIRAQFNQFVDLSQLAPDTTFAEAMEILRSSVQPPLPIVVFWSDLETNAFIDAQTPIGLGGVRRIRLTKALQLILQSVGINSDPLAYRLNGGIIKVGTKQTILVGRMTNKVFNIAELASSPANFGSALNYLSGQYGNNSGQGSFGQGSSGNNNLPNNSGSSQYLN